MRPTCFERVLKYFSNQRDLARHMKIAPQIVTHWKRRGVPPEWWFPLSDLVNGRVAAREFYEEWRRDKQAS